MMRTLAALVAIAALAGCTTTMPPMNVLGKKIDAQHQPGYLGLPIKSGQLAVPVNVEVVPPSR